MHDYLESEQVSTRNKMYRDSGIVIVKHSDKNIFSDLLDLVKSVFVLPDQVYIEMGTREYREIILSLQEKTNSLQFNRRIAKSLKGSIQEFIDEEEFLIQSNTYLRATRPNVSDPESEAIGWHRETFYGPNMERSCNIWTPILNVSEENSLRFIPESHKILDDAIETEHYEEKSNEHGRASHKIGYPYKPKRILAGVNLNKQDIFPLSHIIINNVIDDQRVLRFNISILACDIVNQSKTETVDIFTGNNNLQNILNTQLAVVNKLTQRLRMGDLYTDMYQVEGSSSMTPFYDRFENQLAGWTCTMDVLVYNDILIC